MKRYRCLKETTDRRTYNLARKNLYAICSRCPWHPKFWRSCCDNPYIHMYMEDGTSQIKNPANWKLVSRNRKQWMKKRFIKVHVAKPATILPSIGKGRPAHPTKIKRAFMLKSQNIYKIVQKQVK